MASNKDNLLQMPNAKDDVTEEYVVGGRRGFEYGSEVLSTEVIDKVDKRITWKRLDRMKLDAEVHASVELLIDAIFADGLNWNPAVADDDEEYDQAVEIRDLIQRLVGQGPRRPLEQTLSELTREAFYHGNKVAEIVGTPVEVEGRFYMKLDRLNVKPNRYIGFVVDKFDNIIGVLGSEVGANQITEGMFLTTDNEEIIEREKFVVFVFQMEDNDPRGLSQVRGAVDAYCSKRKTLQQKDKYQEKYAIPLKKGVTAKDAPRVPLTSNGEPVLDSNGVQKTVSAQSALQGVLEETENDSVIVVPFETEVDLMQVEGEGEVFLSSLDYEDGQIRAALLLQKLATGEAKKQTQASTASQTDSILNRRLKRLRKSIETFIYCDLSLRFTKENFGDDMMHLAPKPDLGEMHVEGWSEDIESLGSVGFSLHGSQFDEIDSRLRLPKRVLSEDETDNEDVSDLDTEDDVEDDVEENKDDE